MEDLGDYLYIVFAIIAVVYSFIKKNAQKAKEATAPIFEPRYEEDEYEADQRTIEGSPGTMAPAYHSSTIYPDESLKDQVLDNSMEAKRKQMEQSFSRIKRTSAFKKSDEEEDYQTGAGFVSEFDLRKAIIYAEVLKRPEL